MSLELLRGRLDGIDRRLLELIAERQDVIRGIIDAKRAAGYPLRDYRREREVFEKARTNAAQIGVSPDIAEEVLRTLIRYSLTMQEKASMRTHQSGGGLRALVIGGAGKMGGWFTQFLFSQGFDVAISDPNAVIGELEFVDWRSAALDFDYIVVATPLGVMNDVLVELAARRPAGIVFDIGSLKSPLKSGLRALQSAGVQVASVHPMFGPDTELLSGKHVIIVDVGDADAVRRVQSLFDPTMAEVVVMSLDEHDHAAAYILGLTHAVNIAFLAALQRSGESAPRLVQLSSTTFDAQFDIARRVSRENPQLYHAIQNLNAFGAESLNKLSQALEELRAAACSGDGNQFEQIMASGRIYAENRRRNGERGQ